MKTNYQTRKKAARSAAIEWQNDFCNHDYSYGECNYFEDYFCRLGKRYGLLEEFRENGLV